MGRPYTEHNEGTLPFSRSDSRLQPCILSPTLHTPTSFTIIMADSKHEENGTTRTTGSSRQNSWLRNSFLLRIACLVPAQGVVWFCAYLYFGRDGSPPSFPFWGWLMIYGLGYGIADIMQRYIVNR